MTVIDVVSNRHPPARAAPASGRHRPAPRCSGKHLPIHQRGRVATHLAARSGVLQPAATILQRRPARVAAGGDPKTSCCHRRLEFCCSRPIEFTGADGGRMLEPAIQIATTARFLDATAMEFCWNRHGELQEAAWIFAGSGYAPSCSRCSFCRNRQERRPGNDFAGTRYRLCYIHSRQAASRDDGDHFFATTVVVFATSIDDFCYILFSW